MCVMKVLLLFFVFVYGAGYAEAAEEIRRIPVRADVTLEYFFKTPEYKAKGVMVMFPRGGGQDHFKKGDKGISVSNDFLMRSISRFVGGGYAVAVVGMPSDLELMNDDFRFSETHYSDVRKLCESLATAGYESIYLVSSGSGSLSLLSMAKRPLPPQVKGVMLTNPYDIGKLPVPPVIDSATLPILIIQHEADECGMFTLEGTLKTRDMLAKLTKVTLVRVSGGKGDLDNPCDSLGFHGFYGVEQEVVKTILDWVAGKAVPGLVGGR